MQCSTSVREQSGEQLNGLEIKIVAKPWVAHQLQFLTHAKGQPPIPSLTLKTVT